MQLGLDGEKLSWGMKLACKGGMLKVDTGLVINSVAQGHMRISFSSVNMWFFLLSCSACTAIGGLCVWSVYVAVENSSALHKQSYSRSGTRVKAHSLTCDMPFLLLYWTGLTTWDKLKKGFKSYLSYKGMLKPQVRCFPFALRSYLACVFELFLLWKCPYT